MAGSKPADRDDEQHRKFREALERKRSKNPAPHAEGAANEGVHEAHNDTHVQPFRRKSV